LKRLKQLGKDSVIYGLGGIMAKGIGFFLLPLYTRIFTPADYGTIEMMSVIVSLLTSVLVMGMDSAQSFYFFEQKEKGKPAQGTVISAILQWRLTWGLGIVLVAGTSAPLINAWFFNGELPWIYFGVSFAGALFVTVMNQSVEIFRLLYRPWSYIGVTMIQTILGAVMVLFFVLVLEQGVFSFFLGSAISGLTTAIFGWYRVRDYLDFSTWHYQWWPRLLKFGAPLLPAGFAIYVMSTADRWFIQHYHGPETLGVYAVGAKFAMLMALGIDTFRKAWWPIAMDAMHSDDGPETFRMIARMFMGLGVAAVVYLTFLAPWLVKWLTGPSFHDAWPLVGIVAWKSLFYGFFLISCPGIWKAEKTYITAINMAIAGSVNIGLNFLWVPQYGGMGAALATAVTYFVWIMISMIISERLWPVQFPVTLLLGQVGLGAIMVGWLTLAGSDVYVNAAAVNVLVGILIFSTLDKKMWKNIKSGFIELKNAKNKKFSDQEK
jgi:O-antigen/teichoic acid export membrane protein